MSLTVELPPELERRLEEEAAHQGVGVASLVLAVLEERFGGRPDAGDLPAWLQLVEIGNRMPEEERRAFPSDSSENVDHYLYGAPRKSG